MNLAACKSIIKDPIESTNKVLLFTFSYSFNQGGDVIAYDRLLEVSIHAKWEFIQVENDILIQIDGFDIVKFGRAGLKCKMSELIQELTCLESAYDLCFGR